MATNKITTVFLSPIIANIIMVGSAVAQPDETVVTRPKAAQRLMLNGGSDQDPNLPNLAHDLPSAPIHWTPGESSATVQFNNPAAIGQYLGFNDQGSWIRNENDGKVYVWNLKTGTISVGAIDMESIPIEVLVSLRNSQYSEGILKDRGIKLRPDATNYENPTVKDHEDRPNFPPVSSPLLGAPTHNPHTENASDVNVGTELIP